ncbi:Ribonuclease P protein subunit [Mycena indigotica]|uniref:Ribonuclease P protein subunit n=1 Tax=Mycena indigotica TaxID=2126181 RepID=A0A8H6S4D1_9AGAR|nr:Ribonuclease P protein subunit [Mycena indigotica]KAF7291990.1 Ribonuclease P protein subunit [Mycena indigotica]
MTTVDLYAGLPSNKGPEKLKFTAADPFTPTYIQQVVTKNSNPQEIYHTRVHGRVFLLENTKQNNSHQEMLAKKQAAKEAKERRRLGVSGKRHGTARAMGLWSFDHSQAKFALFLPLHQLWLGYMSELLNLAQPGSGPPRLPSAAAIHPRLVKADFHGSIMTVHQSKNTSVLGVSGIVIHETEGTFKIVTKDDKLKIIPKRNTIFTFAVPVYSTLPASFNANTALPLPDVEDSRTVLDGPHAQLELYGNQFCFRGQLGLHIPTVFIQIDSLESIAKVLVVTPSRIFRIENTGRLMDKGERWGRKAQARGARQGYSSKAEVNFKCKR